jgi:hypothetical protein
MHLFAPLYRRVQQMNGTIAMKFDVINKLIRNQIWAPMYGCKYDYFFHYAFTKY